VGKKKTKEKIQNTKEKACPELVEGIKDKTCPERSEGEKKETGYGSDGVSEMWERLRLRKRMEKGMKCWVTCPV
jgi:hypothetical protein